MSQRTEIVRIAAGEIGYKESANNNTKYGAWYGMNHNPWCAMFVSWCAARAKIPVTVVPKLAYVPYVYSFYKESGRYKSRGAYTPRPGDIVLFGSNDHIGIVEKVVNGSVVTIEGNTSAAGNSSNGDGVYRRTRALSNSWIKGYCIPNYEEEEEDVEIQTVKVKSLDTGELVDVSAVNIKGNNYIKLRDVEKLFPVTIDYDGVNPTMKLNYKEK